MSPVAETWDKAITRLLTANKARGKGPTTLRQLSFAIEGNQESWKRTINRVREKNRASESTALALSRGLECDREELPAAATRLTVEQLEDQIDDRLEVLEEKGVQVADLAPVWRILRLLASGKSAEALHVLSELEAQ